MKALGRALIMFAKRPAVQMACVSFAEHAVVCLVDSAIVHLKKWEKSLREIDNTVTINGS